VAERLGHHHRVRVIEAGTAPGLGLGEAEIAQPAELAEDLVRREDLGGLPFVDVRIDLLVDERADCADLVLRVTHGRLSYARATPRLGCRRAPLGA
jgi:hypothetical protein